MAITNLFQKNATQQQHDELVAELREAGRAIIELQTMMRRQQEDQRALEHDLALAKEQSAVIAAANTAQREALQYQSRLINTLQIDMTKLRTELDTTSKFAAQLQDENAKQRDDILFWWSIAHMFKQELEALGVVKPEIIHNGIKC